MSNLPPDAALDALEVAVPRIQQRIAQLEQAVKAAMPNAVELLKDVHNALREYPDSVHLISSAERAVVVQACAAQAAINIQLQNKKSGRSSTTGKKLKDVTEDDI